MTLSDTEVARLRKILWEIRREVHTKGRSLFVDNKIDRATLLLKKAERKSNRIKKEKS